MALDLNVSRIRNTVTFDVDKVSMKAAKDSIKEVEKFAENLQPSLKMDKIKKQMADVQKEFKALAKNSAEIPVTISAKPPKNSTTPKPSSSSGSSSGTTQAGQDRAERQRKARLDTSSILQERFNYQAGRLRAVPDGEIDKSRLILSEAARAFEEGDISARRLTATLTRELSALRDIGKTNTNIANGNYKLAKWRMSEMVRKGRERKKQQRREEEALRRQERIVERTQERRRERLTEGFLGLNPRMLMAGLGISAAVEGVSRIVESLRSTAERVNLTASGARNVQTNPNAIMAITAYGQANGIDSANIKKAIDNIKDVRERIASSVMSASLNKKGQWTGGDSGIDQVMNTFGWNPNQIKRFQSNPLDFIQAIENEGQRRGMAPAQIGHLMENLGDDLMHYEPAFRNGGAEIIKFAQMVSDAGANINDSTAEAAKSFMVLDAKLGLVEQGVGNNFLVGFMDGLKTDSTSFASNVKSIDKAAEWLGSELGNLATQVGVFVNSISGVMGWLKTQWPFNKMVDDPTPSTQQGNAGSALIPPTQSSSVRSFDDFLSDTDPSTTGWGMLSNMVDRLKNSSPSLDGLNDNQFSFLSSQFSSGSGLGYQNQLPQLSANLVIPDSALQVNIIPDTAGFSQYLSAEVSNGFNTQLNQLTLDTMSSTSMRD